MADPVETMEDDAAGVLNGVMIFLLGALIPALLAWQAITHWRTLAAHVRSSPVIETAQAAALTVLSLIIARYGFAMALKNARRVWRRLRPAVD